jgi:hypothetical protein
MTEIKKHISFSEYRLYTNCPHKHYLSKVLGLTEPKNMFLAFGSALHSSIEEIIKGNKPSLLYPKIFTKFLHEECKDIETPTSLVKMLTGQGLAILKRLNLSVRYKDYEVIGIEENLYEFLFKTVDDIEVNFKGFIDLILKHKETGKYLIIDWKSSGDPWNIEEKKKDELFFGQLVLYKHFFSKKYDILEKEIEAQFVTLARSGWPTIQDWEMDFTDEFSSFVLNDIKRVAQIIVETKTYDKLDKAKHISKDPKKSCAYCIFNKPETCNSEKHQIVVLNDNNKT